MTKIVICGGHLTPALALIEELEKESDVEIIFFGREFSTEGSKNPSAEYKIIQAKKIEFVKITAGRLQRKFTPYTITSLLKVPIGFFQSLYFLIKYRPQIVVSFGSYLSVPVVFASWLLGIESVAHEQATVPGLSTKINSLFVKKLFLSWQSTKKYFEEGKVEVIGNLTRSTIFSQTAKDAKVGTFIRSAKNLLFITGGNQGSHFLNNLTQVLMPQLKNYSILHQVGTTNYKGDLDRAKSVKNKNYLPVDYLKEENFGAVLKQAKIIISRSGANTVWDIAALSKCAIFVPLPHSAGNEQLQNAKVLEDAKTSIVVDQKNAKKETMLKIISNFEEDLKTYQKNADAFAKKLPKEASSKMAKFILSLNS